MSFDIRLLCMDIDGTLLDSAHKLPSGTRRAIQWAAEQGIVTCLMTARPPQATKPIMDVIGITVPVVFFSGALVMCDNETIYDARIPNTATTRVIMETSNRHLHLSIYRDEDWYVSKEDKWGRQESTITGVQPVVTNDLKELVSYWGDGGAHKLLCMGEPSEIEKLGRAVARKKLPLELLRSKNEYLEIMPENVGKAEAMKLLCSHLDIPLSCVMAIGDHDNDCGMLRDAGFGVAMGNASEAAKQAAKFITLSNDEAGAAYAIRKLIQEGEMLREIPPDRN